VKGVQVCSNKRPGPLQRGDNHKNVKMGWVYFKIFSRTIGPNLTRFGTNYSLVKKIQVSSNKWPGPLQRGDNHRTKASWLN
jgi:hypothetical protein